MGSFNFSRIIVLPIVVLNHNTKNFSGIGENALINSMRNTLKKKKKKSLNANNPRILHLIKCKMFLHLSDFIYFIQSAKSCTALNFLFLQ